MLDEKREASLLGGNRKDEIDLYKNFFTGQLLPAQKGGYEVKRGKCPLDVGGAANIGKR